MTDLLHDLVVASKNTAADMTALICGDHRVSYAELDAQVRSFAGALASFGCNKQDRVAIYLPKLVETVVSIFGATQAGGIFVPVNPVLKSTQVAHILRDCSATVLITSSDRLSALRETLAECADLRLIVVVDSATETEMLGDTTRIESWADFVNRPSGATHRVIDADIGAILYTSGSTGKPKGVVLSHRNLVAGAKAVSEYLENDGADCLLAALPLSFDAGFSQVTTAFHVGASVVLHDYFFPRDIVKIAAEHRITGLTAVPPLWAQIADQDWPTEATRHLRYFANTGGKMPRRLLARLREMFPKAQPFLMYGLTEAFRSTYLPPSEVDRRPDSIGKAIPNAEILVVRDDGTECEPDEPGELVHRGALVAQGYWNSPDKTRDRFRPLSWNRTGVPLEEVVVWSGDTVRKDEDGYLYFVGRKDDMIKTSGYRVSPTEVEEVGFESGLVKEIAAIGLPDERLGQKIIVVAAAVTGGADDTSALLSHYSAVLPAFMVPQDIRWRTTLPRSANGKIDRQKLIEELSRH